MARAYLHGVGCASVHGAGVQVLASASAFPSVLPTPRAPQRVAGRSEKVRFGRLDRPCKLGVIAASDLLDGSTALLEGCPPEQRAIVIGTAFGAHRANEQFESQIARDEPAGSPRLFAYTLASTAAAELSILLDLRGPLMTLAEGAGAGLSAIAQAADLIASGAARCAVTGAVESVGETLAASRRARVEPLGDGAVLFVASAERAGAWARVAGWGQRRAGERDDATATAGAALQVALAEAELDAASVAERYGAPLDAPGPLRALCGNTFAAEPLLAMLRARAATSAHGTLAALQSPLALAAWDEPGRRCDVLLLAPP